MLATVLPETDETKAWISICRRVTQERFERSRLLLDAAAIDIRDLWRQVLLHMPRFDYPTRRRPTAIRQEVDRLIRLLVQSRQEASISSQGNVASLDSLRFGEVEETVCNKLLASYHYLRSPRDTVAQLGMFAPGQAIPISLMTLSAFDLSHIQQRLQPFQPHEILVLSRVYAGHGAPRNCLSVGFSHMMEWVRKNRPECRLLLTYLNPNLGFDGSSLRASNWKRVCSEQRTYYLYLNDQYMTDREAFRRFGTSNFHSLSRHIGLPISRSMARLAPLWIFGFTPWPKDRDFLAVLAANPFTAAHPMLKRSHACNHHECVEAAD